MKYRVGVPRLAAAVSNAGGLGTYLQRLTLLASNHPLSALEVLYQERDYIPELWPPRPSSLMAYAFESERIRKAKRITSSPSLCRYMPRSVRWTLPGDD